MATRTRSREQAPGHVGSSALRIEDDALLRGQGWFIDDLDPLPNIAVAAIVRSPFAHARIGAIDVSAALDLPGVIGVVTGTDVAAHSRPFGSALGAGIVHYAAAVDVARYVGEPVCVVVARDRYIAEDAAERVLVDYDPLPVAASVEAAMVEGAPVLHEALGSNVAGDRSFSYGDPDAAFAGAAHVVREHFRQPRSSATPVECYGAIAISTTECSTAAFVPNEPPLSAGVSSRSFEPGMPSAAAATPCSVNGPWKLAHAVTPPACQSAITP